MCLIAFAWGASARFPFVIAANRDEFLSRPTAPLADWQTPSGIRITSGRDLQGGGTWMGFTAQGRFAMLTNVRDPEAISPAQPISRGDLALGWLQSDLAAAAWAQTISARHYQGFNLIVGDWRSKQCHYLTNQQFFKPFEHITGVLAAPIATYLIAREMPWGAIYGLSNAALDVPWPKTQRLKTALQSSLNCTHAAELTERALQALVDQSKPPTADLPPTGVAQELELALSSIFVSHPPAAPSYGSRSSLVAIFQAEQGLQLTEATHAHNGSAPTRVFASVPWL